MSDYTRIREQFPGDAVRVYGKPCGLKICVTRTLADAAQITVPYLVTYNEMGDDARMQVVCARIRLMVDHEARYYEAGGMRFTEIKMMLNLGRIVFPPIDTNPLAINRIGGAEPALTEDEREQLYEEDEAERGARRILSFHAVAKGSLEVDYARDLDDAPTFVEALAALEAHKARRGMA